VPSNSSDPYDLVDGQQRLTSLVILYHLLCEKLGQQSAITDGDKKRFNPQTSEGNFFFEMLLKSSAGSPKSSSQKVYLQAKQQFQKWLDKPESVSAETLKTTIETKLTFTLFMLENDFEVSKVFETINNRGKPLTQMDLVKNHLLFLQKHKRWEYPNVNSAWAEILKSANETEFRGGEDMDTVLRATVTAMYAPGKRQAGETDYKILKREIGEEKTQFDNFITFLKQNFETFQKLRSSKEVKKNDEVSAALTYLNLHNNIAGVLPLIFMQCQYAPTDAAALMAIEKANFRLYGLPKSARRSDSHNVTLHRIANARFTSYSKNEPVSNLVEDLKALVIDNHPNGLKQIVEALTLDDDEPDDFYYWGDLRYFLARWEQSLRKNQSFDFGLLLSKHHETESNDRLEKEHIFAQQTEKTTILSYKNRINIRRLGNLMLLPKGLNASFSNADVVDKLAILISETGISSLIQNGLLKQYLDKSTKFVDCLELRKNEAFGEIKARYNINIVQPNRDIAIAKTLCDLREEDMIRFALEAWKMPGEKYEEVTFKGVFSFSFAGEAYVSTYENLGNKKNENYVIDTGGLDDPLAARLAERNKVLAQAAAE
jgi:hypothetical protein